MKTINLTNSDQVTFVDDDLYDYLNQFPWRLINNRYVGRGLGTGKNYKTIYIHRIITEAPSGVEVDHKDLNKLNNQKNNLRLCNRYENARNHPGKPNISGYKGVSWHKKNKRWRARIHNGKKEIYLGHFKNKEDAAIAYNEAAIKYFGEFAKLNNCGKK